MNTAESRPKSKVTLYIGLVCLVISAIAAYICYSGIQTATAGFSDLSNHVENEDDADRVKYDLTVPGESTVALKEGDYLIWYTSTKIVHEANFGDEDGDASEPVDDFYGPEIAWNITGPNDEPVLLDEGYSASMNNDYAMVSFNVPADGDYKISADAAAGADFEGFSYKVYDDIFEEQIQAMMESTGDIGTGALKTLGGFAVMALFGLIGLIMMIVYAVSK